LINVSQVSNNIIFKNLLLQCKQLDIEVSQQFPTNEELEKFDLIIDAIFGFSFKGDSVRAPFDKIIEQIDNSKVRVLSVGKYSRNKLIIIRYSKWLGC
jgi:NAD(P)H-hydrate epimerase